MKRASGVFEVSATSEPYHEDEGVQLFRSSYRKTFRGDLEAESVVEVLRAMAKGEESAGYVGIERVEGTLDGRNGSFVLQHSGSMVRRDMSLSVSVVSGTATGELRGLRGEMGIEVVDGEHRYRFDYSFDD